MRKFNIRFALFQFLIFSSFFSISQTKDTVKLSRLLKEVDINASAAKENTPVSYINIKKNEIEKISFGKDIPFVIQYTPSIVSSSDAGNGVGYTNFRLRGSDPTRINVTINGIPINDSESQGVWWVNMPDLVSSVGDIQIQRGVGTSTNGASAFGGTLNLKTNNINMLPYFKTMNSLGSFNTFKNNITFGTGNIKGFSFDGRMSRLVSDGYIDRATSDLNSYYISLNYVGDDEVVNLINFKGKERTYQAWWGVPKSYLDVDSLRTFNYYSYKNEVDNYMQDHYQLHYKKEISKKKYLNFSAHHTLGMGYYEQEKLNEALADYGLENLYYSIDSIVYDSIVSTDLIRRKWLDNKFTGIVYSFEQQNEKSNIIIGGSYNIYKGKHFGNVIWAQHMSNGQYPHRYYNNKSTKTDNNIYAKINYYVNNKFTAFADIQSRSISYDFEGYDEDNISLTNLNQKLNFINPKLGLNYQSNNIRSYAFFGKAEKEPSRNDYVESEYGKYPKSEKLYNVEIGYEIKSKKSNLNFNSYLMYYYDQLVNTGQLNDVGAYIRTNVDESYRAGIEVFGLTNLPKDFIFQATLSLSKNKILKFDEYVDNWDTGEQEVFSYDNTDIAFSPEIIASSRISKKLNNFNISLNSKFVGQQYIDNTSSNERMLESYLVNNFLLSYNVSLLKKIDSKITFIINNIFDEKYVNNAWTYRHFSDGYDPRPDDPYTTLNNDGSYSMSSFFPQASRNYMLSLNFEL